MRYPGYVFKQFYVTSRFLRDKPHNMKKQVKFVMSINEYVITSSDQRSSLCIQPMNNKPEDFPMYSVLKIA